MNRSLAVRLAWMFALAALTIFLLVGVALHHVLSSELGYHEAAELATRMEVIQHLVSRTTTLEKWLRVHEKLDALAPGDASTRVWALSRDPLFEYGDAPGTLRTRLLSARGLDQMVLSPDRPPYRILARTVPAAGERPEVRLVVALDTARFRATMHVFALALLLLCSLGVAAVAGLGYWIARVGLGPLNRLSEEARQIRPVNLSQRLATDRCPTELTHMAAAFNGALDRLEDAYTQLQSFNADVAHELRTPLTNLIGQTQVALSKERSAPDLEDVLQSNLEELNRLRTIVNDMLFLARADQGAAAANAVPTPLVPEIRKTVEFMEFVLDDVGMKVRIEGEARAAVDASLFGRAVTNLLQNAVQYSSPGAELVVRVEQDARGARVAVSNPGAPIPPEHLERLFDRFYRIDESRGNSGENHGLGLSIVKAVAAMHNGAVFAHSAGNMNTVGFTISEAA
ncbi:MAG: heavy metal sensor histidine kinase [Alphaproteobacteria bacterium]|nr:heavy metal sensor histidine kinase [Alphaproteobacteria bacterium]